MDTGAFSVTNVQTISDTPTVDDAIAYCSSVRKLRDSVTEAGNSQVSKPTRKYSVFPAVKHYLTPVIALSVLVIRFVLLFGLWSWNNDISTMLPALHCWYCTDWRAPYGVLWYIVSYPGSFGGPAGYILYVALIDFFAMFTIRKLGLFWPYLLSSFWIFLQAPYDIPILWITLTGLVAWPLSLLGPLAKLPVLAPRYVWNHVFSTLGNSVGSDWLYYELMGVVFICTIAQSYLMKRRKTNHSGLTDKEIRLLNEIEDEMREVGWVE